MPINLEIAGTMLAKALSRNNVRAGDRDKFKDNIAWWMDRYETLLTTEAEQVVHKAATMVNDAIAMRDNAVDLLSQFDEEVDETEWEIARLGGTAFVEQLQPTVRERKAYLDNLYKSLTSRGAVGVQAHDD
ncbi:MAG TPA: hypothetical protein VEG65_04795 [Candidatus Bathyarchaeia archaeon]|nr:hypothetical protein [Candidatus Bathyarchaeia archaeon]